MLENECLFRYGNDLCFDSGTYNSLWHKGPAPVQVVDFLQPKTNTISRLPNQQKHNYLHPQVTIPIMNSPECAGRCGRMARGVAIEPLYCYLCERARWAWHEWEFCERRQAEFELRREVHSEQLERERLEEERIRADCDERFGVQCEGGFVLLPSKVKFWESRARRDSTPREFRSEWQRQRYEERVRELREAHAERKRRKEQEMGWRAWERELEWARKQVEAERYWQARQQEEAERRDRAREKHTRKNAESWGRWSDAFRRDTTPGSAPQLVPFSATFAQWTTSVDLFLAADPPITDPAKFPRPGRRGATCTARRCMRGEKLGVCVHQVEAVFRQNGQYSRDWLKRERLRWHPDKFSARPEIAALAQELFQMFQHLIG